MATFTVTITLLFASIYHIIMPKHFGPARSSSGQPN